MLFLLLMCFSAALGQVVSMLGNPPADANVTFSGGSSYSFVVETNLYPGGLVVASHCLDDYQVQGNLFSVFSKSSWNETFNNEAHYSSLAFSSSFSSAAMMVDVFGAVPFLLNLSSGAVLATVSAPPSFVFSGALVALPGADVFLAPTAFDLGYFFANKPVYRSTGYSWDFQAINWYAVDPSAPRVALVRSFGTPRSQSYPLLTVLSYKIIPDQAQLTLSPLWNVSFPSASADLDLLSNAVVTKDGKVLLVTPEGVLRGYDAATGSLISSIRSPSLKNLFSSHVSLQSTSDGRYAFVSGDNGQVWIDTTQGTFVGEAPKYGSVIIDEESLVAYHWDGNYCTIQQRNIATGANLANMTVCDASQNGPNGIVVALSSLSLGKYANGKRVLFGGILQPSLVQTFAINV